MAGWTLQFIGHPFEGSRRSSRRPRDSCWWARGRRFGDREIVAWRQLVVVVTHDGLCALDLGLNAINQSNSLRTPVTSRTCLPGNDVPPDFWMTKDVNVRSPSTGVSCVAWALLALRFPRNRTSGGGPRGAASQIQNKLAIASFIIYYIGWQVAEKTASGRAAELKILCIIALNNGHDDVFRAAFGPGGPFLLSFPRQP